MMGDFAFDVGSALPYLVDSAAALFGQDVVTKEFRHSLDDRSRLSIATSTHMFVPGMSTAIQLLRVYRPLRISETERGSGPLPVLDSLLQPDAESAIILAPPGQGKTASLHYLYLRLVQTKTVFPLLYSLRDADAVSALGNLVDGLKRGRQHRSVRAVALMIDGYDEISYDERVTVSKLLRDFTAMNRGFFFLSCRTYYEIVDLPVRRFYLQPFTDTDSHAFVEAFLAHQKSSIPASTLLAEMRRRGFDDFLGNPLLLALATILQRGSLPTVPRNALRLLREVVDFLTFGWDKERGISRQTIDGVDGHDLLICLKRIAAAFDQPEGSAVIAEACVKKHLELQQNRRARPSDILLELARWYGLIVPNDSGTWRFVHRTIQDYLAAQFMIETGDFNHDVARRSWRRASYAACLVPDATSYISQSLKWAHDLELFVECCANDAYFYPAMVALDLRDYYREDRQFCRYTYNRLTHSIDISLEQDYLDFVKSPMLEAMVEFGTAQAIFDRGGAIVTGLALSELRKRAETPRVLHEHSWVQKVEWTVKRSGCGEVRFTANDALRGWPLVASER